MFVCKFGGSSLADSGQIKKVRDIIKSSSGRSLVVVSAPGKRDASDIKITDLLYSCAYAAAKGEPVDPLFAGIEKRFTGICRDLDLDHESLAADLETVKQNIISGYGPDYAASRGEYLTARLLSSYFGMEFIDAFDVIRLTGDGRVDPESYGILKDRIAEGKRYIIPGFYGAGPDGKVKTFSRGGSDITGAIVSRSAGAEVYENWTDVSGLLMADPRIFDNPPPVREITYREIRELAFLGANVFHEEAIAPVKDVGIPINIKNTNDPGAPGTVIMESRSPEKVPVAGISGKKGYLPLFVEKFMLDRHPSFHGEILESLGKGGIVPEFVFYGSDSIVYFIKEDKGADREKITALLEGCSCDRFRIEASAAVIGIVGEGLRNSSGYGAGIFSALEESRINVRYVSFGGSDVSFIVGVNEADFQKGLLSVYSALR